MNKNEIKRSAVKIMPLIMKNFDINKKMDYGLKYNRNMKFDLNIKE